MPAHATRLLLAALVAFTVPVSAGSVCATNPEIVAPCFEVRGRLSFWNGTPSARIWRVGTQRMLGVHGDELPPVLASLLTTFDTEAWGTFFVCPFTKLRAGRMQYICVESWRDVSLKVRSGASAAPPNPRLAPAPRQLLPKPAGQ